MDRIIDHLKLTFAAAKLPPPHVFEQVALAAAEESGEYFKLSCSRGVGICDFSAGVGEFLAPPAL